MYFKIGWRATCVVKPPYVCQKIATDIVVVYLQTFKCTSKAKALIFIENYLYYKSS